ncbi:MAG: hypothetical protein ACTSRZ_19410 [Promethearchaeota archaeon]
MTPVNWLPELVLFSSYNGNWDVYVEVLYNYYSNDFIKSKPYFRGERLRVKRHPQYQGKDATFWHLIQEENNNSRIPNIQRCERIRWPKPIIENCDVPEIKIWENKRRGEKRICIWLEERNYLVVLAKRRNYILFWTAYPVDREHTKRKLTKEYKRYLRRLAPLSSNGTVTPSTRGR